MTLKLLPPSVFFALHEWEIRTSVQHCSCNTQSFVCTALLFEFDERTCLIWTVTDRERELQHNVHSMMYIQFNGIDSTYRTVSDVCNVIVNQNTDKYYFWLSLKIGQGNEGKNIHPFHFINSIQINECWLPRRIIWSDIITSVPFHSHLTVLIWYHIVNHSDSTAQHSTSSTVYTSILHTVLYCTIIVQLTHQLPSSSFTVHQLHWHHNHPILSYSILSHHHGIWAFPAW